MRDDLRERTGAPGAAPTAGQAPGTAELIYGIDPLCGWCFGIVPAMRQVETDCPDLPIRIVMAGLFSEEGVRPYAELDGFIRRSAPKLRALTGREPSEAFFRLIATPGLMADSGPPCVAIAHVAGLRPERAVEFAHSSTLR